MDKERLRSKFRGSLLGTMAGDALGVPIEGMSEAQIYDLLTGMRTWPADAPERLLQEELLGLITGGVQQPGTAKYSDDTQMMIGIAESLVACRNFDGADMAKRFADNFEPHRGYGAGAFALILELKKGAPWNEIGAQLFGGTGSFGNGGAMRIAPVGVYCHDDQALLWKWADGTAAITHTHALGRQGAMLQAAAVAVATTLDPSEPFEPLEYLDAVQAASWGLGDAYDYGLHTARDLIRNPMPIWDVAERLGIGIEAHESVPTAVYAFAAHHYSFEHAVSYAVRLGGDCDTIGAMCGAIAGAYPGVEAIPAYWTDALENGPKGRDYVLHLADELFNVYLEEKSRRAG